MFVFPLNSQETVQPSNSWSEVKVWLKFALKKCDKTSHVSIVLPLLQLKNARVS